jgi:DNA-binding NarL/FixJ family response regulator
VNTILIVDDHAGFRTTARALLEADGFVVVGEARDGKAAIATARSTMPEFALVDVGLPGADGFEVAEALRAHDPMIRVVLTSSREAAAFGPRLRTSRFAFLPKDEISARAIRDLVVPA